MPDKGKLNLLICRRNAIKKHLQSFEEYLASYTPDDIEKLKARTKKINELFESRNFDELQDEIDTYDKTPASLNERFTILEHFNQCMNKAQLYITGELPLKQETVEVKPVSLGAIPKTKTKVTFAKLPANTEANEVRPIKEKRSQGLADNAESNEIEPIKEQRSQSLPDNAESNQVEPIKQFVSRYRFLSNELSWFLNLPKQHLEDWKEIDDFLEEFQQRMKRISHGGVSIPYEFFVVLLQERVLNQNLRTRWERFVTTARTDHFPTLKHFFKFMKIEATQSFEYETAGYVYQSRFCPACGSYDHIHVYRCEYFHLLPIKDRKAVVKYANLCQNCLKFRGYHLCYYPPCRYCGQMHNKLLHRRSWRTPCTYYGERYSFR